jgi:predicted RNase H-like nuclease (RuvC/YqgF family)
MGSSSDSDDQAQPAKRDYKAYRMHRNRLSAARSRQAKREYIERLESQVEELSRTVEELRNEKWYWQHLNAPTQDNALHAEWLESLQLVVPCL